MLTLPVAGLTLQILLVDGFAYLDGEACLGVADPAAMTITISKIPPPDKRIRVFWHELGHIIKCECDAANAEWMDEEHLCNIIGLGCSMIDGSDLHRLKFYLTTGIIAKSMAVFPGMSTPVPVLSLDV